MGLNSRTGSKADNVALFANDPHRAHWSRKSIRDMGVRNWKGRRGNLQNRPHPSENMRWEVWLSVTKKRLINRERRAQREKDDA